VVLRQLEISRHHVLLNDDSGSDAFDRTVEDAKKPVSPLPNDPTAMLADHRLDKFALDPQNALVRSSLVGLGKPRVADNVGHHDGGETAGSRYTSSRAFYALVRHGMP
jgi:hypothetical protein